MEWVLLKNFNSYWWEADSRRTLYWKYSCEGYYLWYSCSNPFCSPGFLMLMNVSFQKYSMLAVIMSIGEKYFSKSQKQLSWLTGLRNHSHQPTKFVLSMENGLWGLRGGIKKINCFFLEKPWKGGGGSREIQNFLIRKKWDFFKK